MDVIDLATDSDDSDSAPSSPTASAAPPSDLAHRSPSPAALSPGRFLSFAELGADSDASDDSDASMRSPSPPPLMSRVAARSGGGGGSDSEDDLFAPTCFSQASGGVAGLSLGGADVESIDDSDSDDAMPYAPARPYASQQQQQQSDSDSDASDSDLDLEALVAPLDDGGGGGTGKRKAHPTDSDRAGRAAQKALEKARKAAARDRERADKATAREQERAAKKAAKAAAKDAKEEKRAQDKRDREEAEALARQVREDAHAAAKKAAGGSKNDETCMVMSTALYDTELGIVVRDYFDKSDQQIMLEDSGVGHNGIPECAVQWTWRKTPKEEKQARCEAMGPGVLVRNEVVLLVQADMFMSDLKPAAAAASAAAAAGCPYPRLEKLVVDTKARLRGAARREGVGVRLFLVTVRAEEAAAKAVNNPMSSGGGHAELQEALAWLLEAHRVEAVLCKTEVEASEWLRDVTRALAKLPYDGDFAGAATNNKLKWAALNGLAGHTDLWLRMLGAVSGLSLTKGQRLIEAYPTVRSLMTEYGRLDLSEAEKRALLADKMGERSAKALSAQLFEILTSTDHSKIVVGGKASAAARGA